MLSGYVLGPVYASLASGIGAGMSDVFLGYGIYAPFTFIIKACMSVAVYFITKNIKDRTIPVQISLIFVATLFAELMQSL